MTSTNIIFFSLPALKLNPFQGNRAFTHFICFSVDVVISMTASCTVSIVIYGYELRVIIEYLGSKLVCVTEKVPRTSSFSMVTSLFAI